MSKKLGAALVSIFVNVGLLVSKVMAAVITGSVSLFAESAHSLFDLFSSLLAYLGIRQAEKPSDESHSYGHEKFESLSSFLQALFISVTAIIVIYEAYKKLIHPTAVENSEVGIVLMLISVPVTLLTARYLSKIAKSEGGSHALEADSAHFTTDVLSSIAVLVGLGFVRFGYGVADAIAALVVGLIMLYISVMLIKESYLVFLDYNPKKETMQKIEGVLKKEKEIGYHELKARRAGSKILVETHIQVPGNMHVHSSHRIAGKIKEKMMKKVPQIKDVTIHIEPKTKKRKARKHRKKK